LPETPFAADRIAAILLDIEGTTTPVDFVHKTLFSYARRRMQDFLERHWAEPAVRADIEGLRNQYRLDQEKTPQPLLWREDTEAVLRDSALGYINWLMDNDSKCTPLKSLQGKIWKEGYAGGELKSEVYPDVAPAFARWSGQKKIISIFSSGSVQAQQLLFANTTAGDLTPLIRGYFDTTTGPKRHAESYSKIAAALDLSVANALFVSDTVEELDAARQAGMKTALCVRASNSSSPTTNHKLIRTFDELAFSS
jgi:enolase-phosphatase E1